jgi:UDP-glucuronate decarboxylase
MTSFLLQSDIEEIVANMSIGSLSEFGGKHILLTGGRGFLGRYFTAVFQHLNLKLLKDNPVRLTVMDNLISAGPEGAQIPTIDHITFLQHDCIKPLPDIGKVDFILHAADIILFAEGIRREIDELKQRLSDLTSHPSAPINI